MHSSGLRLHSALRRESIAEFERFARIYVDTGASSMPESARSMRLFPRYLFYDAVREALERIDADTLGDFEATRACVLDAIRTAHNAATDNVVMDPIARAAMEEERTTFLSFASRLTEQDVRQVGVMPYRHIMSEATRSGRWEHVAAKWQIDQESYWYPLDASERSDAIGFDRSAFEAAIGANGLQQTVQELSDSRVWEFRELGASSTIDLSLLDPQYDSGGEGYWSPPDLSWIVYASHESSVTIGGEELLAGIRRRWPDWKMGVWTGWQ